MSQIAVRTAVPAPREDRRPASEAAGGESPAASLSPLARAGAWLRQHPDLAAVGAVLIVGLLFRLALLYRVPPLFMPGDSQSFLTPAYDLARGLGFDPILKRPLGYPLLLASVIALLGEDLRGLVFVQAMLGLVTVATTYWIGRLVFGRATGCLAALSVAIGGQLLIYEHYILAESVFAMLLALAVLALVAASRSTLLVDGAGVLAPTLTDGNPRTVSNEPPLGVDGRAGKRASAPSRSVVARTGLIFPGWRLAAAGGAALAAASLFRPIAEVMVPLLPVFFLAAVRPRRHALGLTVVAMVGFVMVMAPAFVADLVLRGGASSGALGEHLLWRITRSDSGYLSGDDVPPADTDSPQAAARRFVIREAVDRTLPQMIFTSLRDEYGLSAAEADSVMRAVALEAIGRQAGRYVTSTLWMSVELFFGQDQPLGEVAKRTGEPRYIDPQSRQRTWFEDRVLHLGEPPSAAVANEFDTAGALVAIYQPGRIFWLIAPGVVIGAALTIVSRRYRLGLLLALALPPMLLANAALAGPEARFRYPLDPLIAVVAFGGLVWLAQLAWTTVRRHRSGGSVPGEATGSLPSSSLR